MAGDDTSNSAFVTQSTKVPKLCDMGHISDLRKKIRNPQDTCTIFILEEYVISKYAIFRKKKKGL